MFNKSMTNSHYFKDATLTTFFFSEAFINLSDQAGAMLLKTMEHVPFLILRGTGKRSAYSCFEKVSQFLLDQSKQVLDSFHKKGKLAIPCICFENREKNFDIFF